MRKNNICTDTRCRKKHSTIGKVGIGALLTITLSGLTYPVYVYADEPQNVDVIDQNTVIEESDQITDFDNPVDEAKRAAGKKVYQASKMVDAQIQNLPNLTTQQKNDFGSQVNSEVMKALANINATKTPNDAMDAGDAGVVAIEGILKTAKEADSKNIYDAAHEAVDVIRKKSQSIADKIAESSLPQNIKDSLSNTLKDKTDAAINNIKECTTVSTIHDARDNGIKSLDAVDQDVQAAIDANKPLSDAKKEAIEKVEASGKKAHATIDNLSHLSSDERMHFKDMVDVKVKEYIDAINNANTPEDAQECGNRGVSCIHDIVQQARDIDNKNANMDDPVIPQTSDVSGLASGLLAGAGTLISSLGIKKKIK